MRGSAESYEIPPSPAVTLDASGATLVTVKLPADFGGGLNAIHLVHGDGEYYRASWDGHSRVTLDASSLSAVRGPERFAGFLAGERYILAVGADKGLPAPGDTVHFAPAWTATIEVRATQGQ